MTIVSSLNNLFLKTYGCQMNVLDSELIADQLIALGYRIVNRFDDANIILINTCSVRALAEQKVWSQLGRLAIYKRQNNPHLIIGVIGCMAEREYVAISQRMPHVDLICGPSHLHLLPSMIAAVKQTKQTQLQVAGHVKRGQKTNKAETNISNANETSESDNIESLDLSRLISSANARSQAFVRITRGCDKMCSFCVVPYARGPETHRHPQHIIDEVCKLTLAGAREITLIGQTVNHYHYHDGGVSTSFADLLWQIHEAVPSLARLRFVTSYPRDFNNDVLEVMAKAKRMARYLHLPAQSGSNKILRAMNRGYTVESYIDLIDRARAFMPDVRFAGDMIVGFPTETEADHQESIKLIERVGYKNLFVFKYSPRPGTVAARRFADDVSEDDKKRRNHELLDVQARLSHANNNSLIGTTLEVLVESESKLKNTTPVNNESTASEATLKNGTKRLLGRTTYDEIVAFTGSPELIGKIVKVKTTAATSLTLLGELIN
ncbi:MAG: tRNA (N6-isopentenyl adenosine(37)-C2)-methylthiotransferase MiaB [Deltaproteobacteria bacterium]|nr:tRNA (N6-isopentenyl adenosine(37)-C2)-methylthiotransferase MiaB [Deltaproteobacteria bacterium]